MGLLQRTEYDIDPLIVPCSDVLVVQPAGVSHAFVYIPPVKGSVPTVEVYADAGSAKDRAACLCETEGLPSYCQMTTSRASGCGASSLARRLPRSDRVLRSSG